MAKRTRLPGDTGRLSVATRIIVVLVLAVIAGLAFSTLLAWMLLPDATIGG